MLKAIAIYGSLLMMVLILASVLGAVKPKQRFFFVAGIALFIAVHVLGDALPSALVVPLVVLGVLAAVGSTVPLLRQPIKY